MEKIINKLINEFTQGVDTYTHNGSTWLIFTESKQWVIELTDSKTLWYNYNFFKGIFSYTSMDVVEHQSYITKWVEDNIINKVSDIRFRDARDNKHQFEDTLQNGVKNIDYWGDKRILSVEDTLGNGVKRTYIGGEVRNPQVEDTIENGVIKTKGFKMRTDWSIEDTIENGVKETRWGINITEGEVDDIIQDGVKVTGNRLIKRGEIEDIIDSGVKETIECDWNIPKYVINEVVNDGVKYTFPNSETGTSNDVERVIKNGVKDTYSLGSLEVTEKEINNTLQNGVRDTQSNPYENESWIEGVIKNGVKETKQKKNAYLVLDTSGRELILESHLVIRDGVKETNYDTDNYTDDVKEVIREGVKKTLSGLHIPGAEMDVNHIIENGVKMTAPLKSREYTGDIDEVLGNGVRNSHPLQYRTKDIIDKVIDKGIKETHDDVYHHKGRIDGVIKNGVKEVVSYDEHKRGPVNTFGYIDDIIKEGEKINGTYAGGQRQSEKCKSVVEYGTKNPTD